MKNLKRLAALFTASVFALSAFCVTAGAEESVGEGEYAGGDSSVVAEDPVTPDYNTDSSTDYDPGYDNSSSYSDYSSAESSYSDESSYSSSYSESSADDYYGSSDSSDYSYNDYSSSYVDYDYSSSYYSDDNNYGYGDYYSSSSYEDYNYYGEGAQSSDNSYYESPTDSLIQSEENIDDSTLSNNDWSDIAKALSNAGTETDGNDADDFSFIKNNTSTGDNGHWMLYVSIALIVTSFAGIAYFIGSSVLSRKRAAAGGRTAARADDYGAHARRMRSDDYDDNYYAGGKQKHRKHDTAEIKLSVKGSSSGSGGRRYK